MSDRSTTLDDHDPLAHAILKVLEDFIYEVGVRECTAHFDKVVDGKYYLKGKHLVQKPERFTKDHLAFPMLRQVFGYSLRPQPKQYAPRWPRGGGVPDFAITSVPIDAAMQNDLRFFGEVKPTFIAGLPGRRSWADSGRHRCRDPRHLSSRSPDRVR